MRKYKAFSKTQSEFRISKRCNVPIKDGSSFLIDAKDPKIGKLGYGTSNIQYSKLKALIRSLSQHPQHLLYLSLTCNPHRLWHDPHSHCQHNLLPPAQPDRPHQSHARDSHSPSQRRVHPWRSSPEQSQLSTCLHWRGHACAPRRPWSAYS